MASSRSAPWLRRTGLVLVALALAGAVNVVATLAASAQDPQLDPALVRQGSDLYQAHCVSCHGAEGVGLEMEPGVKEGGPPLTGVGAASVDFMLRTGRMPAETWWEPLERRPPAFDGTERAALVAYVTSLPGEGPPIPNISGWPDADLARGRELFTTNCAACHGPTAAGIAVGQDDVSSNLEDVEPIVVAEAIRTGPGVMPVFGEEILGQEDLEAVVAWVDNLGSRTSPGGVSVGRSGPVSEGFIAWLVGMGLLGIVVYVLGERIGTEVATDTAKGPAPSAHDEGSGDG